MNDPIFIQPNIRTDRTHGLLSAALHRVFGNRTKEKNMDCPKCGEECSRDEADVGVGILYGPYGCMCGWSEHPNYDSSEGESAAQQEHPDYLVDSQGRMVSKTSVEQKLKHFGIDTEGLDL